MSAPRIAVISHHGRLPDRVRDAVRREAPQAAVEVYVDLASAIEEATGADVLVAGPPCRGPSALGALAAFHEQSPSTGIVLAFERPHVDLRHIVWIGAEAIIDPESDDEVEVAVTRAVRLARLRGATAPVPAADPAAPLGRVLTVCSATGGCGKTFYATNAAYFLAHWAQAKVALVDLDLQFGEVTTALRLRVRHTIADALAAGVDPDDGLGAHIEELVTPHDPTGVDVLAAPHEPGEADRVTPAEVARVIEALRAHYDYVVVDTPTGLGDAVLAALDLSEELILLASLDLPSIRNLRLFLQTLERLEIPDDLVSLVLNKAQRGLGVEVDEVKRVFTRDFHAVLPYAPEVQRSMNRGLPVLHSDPEAEVSRRLAEDLADLLPDDARERFDAAQRTERGVLAAFRRWRGRRSDQPTTVEPPAAGESPRSEPAAVTGGADA